MSNFIRKNKMSLSFLLLGLISISIGIYRKEPVIVLNKSNIICLECIGIG